MIRHGGNMKKIKMSSVLLASALFIMQSGAAEAKNLVLNANVSQTRNDFNGYVGMQIKTGDKALSVTHLGRMYVPRNGQVHSLRLIDSKDLVNGLFKKSLAEVNVSLAHGKGFMYGRLNNPVTLLPNSVYFLVSSESYSGDSWYEADSQIEFGNDASVVGGVYSFFSSPDTYLIPWASTPQNQTNTPLDFKYEVIDLPAAPTGLVALCGSNGDLYFSWNQVAGADDYLFRVDDTIDSFFMPESDIMTQTKQIVYGGKGLPGHTYNFWVHGNNASGYGAPSGKSVTCPVPASPSCGASVGTCSAGIADSVSVLGTVSNWTCSNDGLTVGCYSAN